MLKEQFVLGLRDDNLRREIKKLAKEQSALTFNSLMQSTIDWSEEASQNTCDKRGVVNRAEKEAPGLSLQALHESIQKLADKKNSTQLSKTLKKKMPPSQDRKEPHRDETGLLICYSCGKPGHVSQECQKGQGKWRQSHTIDFET